MSRVWERVRVAVSNVRLAVVAKQYWDMLGALARGAAGGTRSWSQYHEDAFLKEYFEGRYEDLFYCDVGANHPVKLSNTYRLYCCGMRGITVEPHSLFASLHRRFRAKDIHISAGAGKTAGIATLNIHRYHGLSNIECGVGRDEDIVRKERVPILPLKEILAYASEVYASRECGLLSIDVEGMDEEVLASNDWEVFRPELVLIEAEGDEHRTAIDQCLTSVGYSYERSFEINRLYRRDCSR